MYISYNLITTRTRRTKNDLIAAVEEQRYCEATNYSDIDKESERELGSEKTKRRKSICCNLLIFMSIQYK